MTSTALTKPGQQFPCLTRASGRGVRVSKDSEAHRAFVRKPSGNAYLVDRLFVSPFLQVGPAKPEMGLNEVRVKFESLPILFDRAIVLTGKIQYVTHCRIDGEGKRIQLQGSPNLCQGFIQAPHGLEKVRIELMGGGIVGIEGNGTSKLALSLDP